MFYNRDKKYYIVFPSTRIFLKALPLIEQEGLTHRVVSIPDRLSDQCGMAIEIYGNCIDTAINIISKVNIQYEIKE